MGRDIHMVCEYLEAPGWTPWQLGRAESLCEYPGHDCPAGTTHPGYGTRNYYVHELVLSLAEPLPHDLAPLTKRLVLEDDELLDIDSPEAQYVETTYGTTWLGDHSFGVIGLDVLLAFDWDAPVAKPRWKTSPTLTRANARTKMSRLEELSTTLSNPAVLEASWKSVARGFYTHYLPNLQKLGQPQDVRVVFGFDS